MEDNCSDICIFPFEIVDYEEVINLWEMCDGIGLSSADSPEKIGAYLERNPGMSFIAKIDGKIAGAVLSGHDGRRGFIHHLAVHPLFRKKGIGRKLANECASALESAGIEKCHLFIFASNESGIKFWGNTGWSMRKDIGIMSRDLDTRGVTSCTRFKGCSC
ncbi:GNAT family N-acetyltransferase [Desulforegula conservatrix]|uniref:GNAT family N-acetyltransferase n=1 Tax=Desulforegula conservatrix TaxID=153026 RepID=UPI000422DA32|nr:GNAT family N-acetyltransferase [Desulforegula conservatrix]